MIIRRTEPNFKFIKPNPTSKLLVVISYANATEFVFRAKVHVEVVRNLLDPGYPARFLTARNQTLSNLKPRGLRRFKPHTLRNSMFQASHLEEINVLSRKMIRIHFRAMIRICLLCMVKLRIIFGHGQNNERAVKFSKF